MPLTTKYEICPDHIIPVAQKQPTFCDATVPLVSPRNDFLRNERRNSILMTRHYPYLGSASDWSCGKCASANQKRYPDLGRVTSSVWNFCTPFSDVFTRNVSFFLRLVIPRLNAFTFYLSKLMSNRYSQFQPSVSELNVPVFIRFKYHTR